MQLESNKKKKKWRKLSFYLTSELDASYRYSHSIVVSLLPILPPLFLDFSSTIIGRSLIFITVNHRSSRVNSTYVTLWEIRNFAALASCGPHFEELRRRILAERSRRFRAREIATREIVSEDLVHPATEAAASRRFHSLSQLATGKRVVRCRVYGAPGRCVALVKPFSDNASRPLRSDGAYSYVLHYAYLYPRTISFAIIRTGRVYRFPDRFMEPTSLPGFYHDWKRRARRPIHSKFSTESP